MTSHNRPLVPLKDRGPLRTLFTITSMPIGGAETLLANLCRRLDPERVLPELCCLKEPGPLGEVLSEEFPLHTGLLRNKWDWRVLPRLRQLLRERRMDAMVTVGAGDKMFWGRLAASRERLPVICSAIHSTGWPDRIGFLNRRLTPVTDAFIAVAETHGRYLVEHEKFPAEKVRVIPNGIDIERFRSRPECRAQIRRELGIPAEAPVVAIIAALRPEKNHELFLHAAASVKRQLPASHFLIIGDGPRRAELQALTHSLGLAASVHFLGSRSDIPELLSAVDVFALTSHIEANPVSILEALACGVPVVATHVGSVSEMVEHGNTGFLVQSGDIEQAATFWADLLMHSGLRWRFGIAGRERVCRYASLDHMVRGYEELLCGLYEEKCLAPDEVTVDQQPASVH